MFPSVITMFSPISGLCLYWEYGDPCPSGTQGLFCPEEQRARNWTGHPQIHLFPGMELLMNKEPTCRGNFIPSSEGKHFTWLSSLYMHVYNLGDPRASLEKAMATHSSTLAWKISWMEEPGRLQSIAKSWTWLSEFTFMHWRRKWQPTPVFLPGESQGWGA